LSGVSVFIAMPTHRDIPPRTVLSLLQIGAAARKHEVPLSIAIDAGVSDVELGRAISVHRFLKSDATKLFWMDSDIACEPDTFMRIVALSTKVDAVMGAYSKKTDPLEFMVNTNGAVLMNEWGCIPVDGGAIGFSIFSREAVEALWKRSPVIKFKDGEFKDELVRNPFRKGVSEEGYGLSEDVMFFKDIRALGFEVWCDPAMRLSHIGTKAYEGSFYDYMLAQQRVAAE
jgi:hypothetical protein